SRPGAPGTRARTPTPGARRHGTRCSLSTTPRAWRSACAARPTARSTSRGWPRAWAAAGTRRRPAASCPSCAAAWPRHSRPASPGRSREAPAHPPGARRPRPRPHRRLLPQARELARRSRAGGGWPPGHLARRAGGRRRLRARPLRGPRRAVAGAAEPPAPGLRRRLAGRGGPSGCGGARRRRACARAPLCRPDRRLLLHGRGSGREPGGVLVRAADQSERPAPGRLTKALCRRPGGEMPSLARPNLFVPPNPVDSTVPPGLRHSALSTAEEKRRFPPPALSFWLPPPVAPHTTHEPRNDSETGRRTSERGELAEDGNSELGDVLLANFGRGCQGKKLEPATHAASREDAGGVHHHAQRRTLLRRNGRRT